MEAWAHNPLLQGPVCEVDGNISLLRHHFINKNMKKNWKNICIYFLSFFDDFVPQKPLLFSSRYNIQSNGLNAMLGHKRSALWDRLVKIYIFPEGLHVLKTGGKDELSSSKLFFFSVYEFY